MTAGLSLLELWGKEVMEVMLFKVICTQNKKKVE